jgi:hypothetical protein
MFEVEKYFFQLLEVTSEVLKLIIELIQIVFEYEKKIFSRTLNQARSSQIDFRFKLNHV